MKKTIFTRKASAEEAVEKWSVKRIAEKLGIKLTHRNYPSVSDQEIEVWESVPEPWKTDSASFIKAFLEYFKYGGE